MEVTPPAHGLPSWQSQASHISHHCSSHSLTMNQPCAEGCPLGSSKKPSRHWLQDPGNSHPSTPIVLSPGVLKSLTLSIWLWTLVPRFSYPGLLPSPGWWLTCPHPPWTAQLVEAPASIIFTLASGEEGNARLLSGFCHQGRRIKQAPNLCYFCTFSPLQSPWRQASFRFRLHFFTIRSSSVCAEPSSIFGEGKNKRKKMTKYMILKKLGSDDLGKGQQFFCNEIFVLLNITLIFGGIKF